MLDLTELSFYGSEFDRAAHLRSKINDSQIESNSKNLIVWRGKILIDQNNFNLVYLKSNHPIISHSKILPIFLGQLSEVNYFAHDISNWVPEDLNPDIKLDYFDQTIQNHPDLPINQNFNDLRFIMTQLSVLEAGLASTAKALFSWHHNNSFCSRCGNKSISTQSGWQRDCEKCKLSQYPRTDPVVIMLVTQGNNILLGRSPQWPEKMYSCLAGFIEPGETLEAAYALGITPGRTMSLIILPQALRIIIPPIISQYLNLTKNSSLAIAVGYMDLTGTLMGITLNQTGRELETVLMGMAIYLIISLAISTVMNWYNNSVKLVER